MSTEGLAAAEGQQVTRTAPRSRQRGKRLRFAIAGLVLVAALGYMIYSAVVSNSEYYLTVSEVQAMGTQPQDDQIKIGGRVVDGSINWNRGSNSVTFSLTDGQQVMSISYKGVVPDSFQPGADVILEGRVQRDGSFIATTMLAKCASKYEPQVPAQ